MGRDQHGVPHRRERRRVAEVELRDLVDGHLVPDRGREHVDALGRALRPITWARQAAGRRLGHHLDRDQTAARVVAGARRRLDRRRAGAESGRRRRARRPGTPTSRSRNFVTAVPITPGNVRDPRSRSHRRPELLVAVDSQRDRGRRAAHAVEDLDAVARGPHARDARCHARVGDDPPVGPTARPAAAAGPARGVHRARARRGRRKRTRSVCTAVTRPSESRTGRPTTPRCSSMPRPRTASATSAPMSGSSVVIGCCDPVDTHDLQAAAVQRPRPSRDRCSRHRPRPPGEARELDDPHTQGVPSAIVWIPWIPGA